MRTSTINHRFFSDKVNLQVPTSWQQMTDEQLTYYAFLTANYNPEKAKCIFAIRLLGIKPKKQIGTKWQCELKGRDCIIEANELTIAVEKLKFLDTQFAVRPSIMQGYKAVNKLLQDDFTFYDYLRTDTFWQMFLKSHDERNIVLMANYLYRDANGDYAKIEKLSETEQAIIILWYIGVKQELTNWFPKFFRTAKSEDAETMNLMQINDAQIRALTGGDITKEKDVLNQQCWRAFAELNAKAKETEELQKIYRKNGI